jgi:hypothetical protein
VLEEARAQALPAVFLRQVHPAKLAAPGRRAAQRHRSNHGLAIKQKEEDPAPVVVVSLDIGEIPVGRLSIRDNAAIREHGGNEPPNAGRILISRAAQDELIGRAP